MKTRVIQSEPDQPPRTDSAFEAVPTQRQETPRRSRVLRPIAVWAGVATVVLIAAYIASAPGSDEPTANGANVAGSRFAEIESFVRDEMAAQRIPGLALAIVEDGRAAYMRGFGQADDSGRVVTPQTPFIIGSIAKSFTAVAVMQLVEAGKVELDAPVQRYLPWFRVADEQASAEITIRHFLNHTSGLSTKTGRSFQGDGDTSDGALEAAVRKLRSVDLVAPVGETYQYSTINYSVLGLVVQAVSGQSYERYVKAQIFDPLGMGRSFTSEANAAPQGLAAGYNYAFGRPRAADLPFNRGLVPAGYLISSAEDMTHYMLAQLDGGRYEGASVLSAAGVRELQRPAVATPEDGTSYGMGWFVGPVDGIQAVHHQGETFNYHANVVLVPEGGRGVVVLMNAQNSLDLFVNDRMATVSEGVASLLEGRDPAPPPSMVAIFLVYAAVFSLVVLQALAIARSAAALRRGQLAGRRRGPWLRIGFSAALGLAWAFLVLVLLPKQLGLPLLVIAQGFPDLAYILLASGLAALVWAFVRPTWSYFARRTMRHAEVAIQPA